MQCACCDQMCVSVRLSTMHRDELWLVHEDGRRNILECQANEYEVGLQACPRAQSVSLLELTLRPRPRFGQAQLLASKHIKFYSGWFGASTLLFTNLVKAAPDRVTGNYVQSRQLAPGERSPRPNCTEVGQVRGSRYKNETCPQRYSVAVQGFRHGLGHESGARSSSNCPTVAAFSYTPVRQQFHFRNASCLVNRSAQFEMSKVMAAVATSARALLGHKQPLHYAKRFACHGAASTLGPLSSCHQ